MSNRKTRKEKNIKRKRREENIRILKKLKKEVIELEEKIKIQKKINNKEKNIRNLKIFGSMCNFSMPFVIVAGLTVGIVKVGGGGFPFIKDDIVKFRRYSLDYQMNGVVEFDQHYESRTWLSETLPTSKLKVYYPYSLEVDGFYRRDIREYYGKQLNDIDLYYAVLRQDLDYIEENFYDYDEEQEFSNKINDEYSPLMIEANLNMLDKKEMLSFEETDTKNFVVTLIEGIFTLGSGAYISKIREFKLSTSIKQINKIYERNITSVEPLEAELKNKKNKILSLSKGGKNNVK